MNHFISLPTRDSSNFVFLGAFRGQEINFYQNFMCNSFHHNSYCLIRWNAFDIIDFEVFVNGFFIIGLAVTKGKSNGLLNLWPNFIKNSLLVLEKFSFCLLTFHERYSIFYDFSFVV